MAKRYLLRGPRIFFLLPRIELKLRRRSYADHDFGGVKSAPALAIPTTPISVPARAIAGSPGRSA